MKRSWIGFALLVALLISGLGVTVLMDRVHSPIADNLEQAAMEVSAGDWNRGEGFFGQAKGDWEKWSHVRSCFADHTPVEEIDALFAQLQVYGAAREDAAFSAGCMELAKKVAAVGDAHGLYWWNVL